MIGRANEIAGAFFDIDGTLVGAPSLELRLAMRLALRGELHPGTSASWAADVVRSAAQTRNKPVRIKALDQNKRWLAGVNCAALYESAKVIARCVEVREGLAWRIREHAACGHPVFFVSGTLAPLARAFAEKIADGLPISVRGTELEVSSGKFTGQVMGAAVCGPEKAAALIRLAAEHGIDLSRSFAYANSIRDIWFLQTVGNPFAISPDPQLAEVARQNRWPVLREKAILRGDPFLATRRGWHTSRDAGAQNG